MWKHFHLIASVLLVCSLFFSACDSHTIIQEESFGDACWDMGDTLFAENFSAERIGVKIVFQDSYAYRNLYLTLQIKDESGFLMDTLLNDTLSSLEGTWFSEPGENTHTWIFRDTLNMANSGDTRAKLFHYMRDSLLCGIESVALIAL